MNTKFIKPASLVLGVLLFAMLALTNYAVKWADEDNAVRGDLEASATTAWAVDNTFEMQNVQQGPWVGPTMLYRDAGNRWAAEAATIAYATGDYSYTTTATTNTYNDAIWTLFMPTSKKARDYLITEGSTDFWCDISLTSTNNVVKGQAFLAVAGEYDSDKDSNPLIYLGRQAFTIPLSPKTVSLHIDHTKDERAWQDAISLVNEWERDVQIMLIFSFHTNYNPDASDAVKISTEAEEVDQNESVYSKYSATLMGAGIAMMFIALWMTSHLDVMPGIIGRIQKRGGFFKQRPKGPNMQFLLILAGLLMLSLALGSSGAMAEISVDELNNGDGELYLGWEVVLCFVLLFFLGGLVGFSIMEGGMDAKNTAAFIGVGGLFVLMGLLTGVPAVFIIMMNPEITLITAAAWIYGIGLGSILFVAMMNYSEGNDEVIKEGQT